MTRNLFYVCAALLFGATNSHATEHAECKDVILGSGGWTDNIVQDALAMNVLKGLGYSPTETELALNVLIEALKNGDVDVHFDYWSPSSDSLVQPYLDENSIEIVRANLTDSKYTIAVPTYAWEAGIKDFADIQNFEDELQGRIYGQSSGSDSNTIILSMIEKNAFGLGNFELIESSEQGMLVQVERAVRNDEFIAFVGWAPHPMNSNYDIKYLSGGDEYFGPNFGSATIYTITTTGFNQRCPNLGRFLENVEFDVDMLNSLMREVLDNDADPMAAAKNWLNAHSSVLEDWLQGVDTFDGQPGLEAVRLHLAN